MSLLARGLRRRQSGGAIDVSQVFATSLYTGNGSTQTITNGIDLAGEGGMVWIKQRSSPSINHFLQNTIRVTGSNLNFLHSNTTDAENADGNYAINAVSATGFTLADNNADRTNGNGYNYVSWTFRKSPRFFDVVTYTGTNSLQDIGHSLGIAPGMILVKRTDSTGDWFVYHRAIPDSPNASWYYLMMNYAYGRQQSLSAWGNTQPSSTNFTVLSNPSVNTTGATYVAYLFAHDDSADGVIQCGSYIGNFSTDGPEINIGWETQYLLIKQSSGGGGDWIVFDSVRGMTVSGAKSLYPNKSNAELSWTGETIYPTSTGFKIANAISLFNASGETYIYLAIKKAS